jgi:Rrf2 family protein
MSNVLRISEAASLAFHAMSMLAEDPERMWQNKEIAGRFKISEAHLSKVLQRLTHAGLVTAVRGPRGGFKLIKAPAEITLLQIYEAIEGKLSRGQCLLGVPRCDRKFCILGGLLKTVNTEVDDYFKKTTLASLVEKTK